MKGESGLPLVPQPTQAPHAKRSSLKLAGQMILVTGGLALLALSQGYAIFSPIVDIVQWKDAEAQCAQADVLVPHRNAEVYSKLSEVLGLPETRARAINWLSGAVKVPTEVYDDMDPVGVDPQWEVFGPFHDYLAEAYPLVHSNLKLTKVNTYGLVFDWIGSDSSLKPILLAAHQDVVPVETRTVKDWTHPPFSGHYDGEKIWGRGSNDDKSGLIGIMSVVEMLLEQGFKPTRTVVLAFGFDEEASGLQGAGELNNYLVDVWGENSFALLVDEGGGYVEEYGTTFATPSVAEKGYLDLRVEVKMPGGHSSVPPAHTSIGVLSSLLVQYEKEPFDVALSREDTLYKTWQCYGEHGRDVSSALRTLIKASMKSKAALTALEKFLFQNKFYKSMIQTTQAITMINGGVKSNALPEEAYGIVNHRISTQSSTHATMMYDKQRLTALAESFNLTYTAFGKHISSTDAPSAGSLTLSAAFTEPLEPAPVTPTDLESHPWRMLSGTIKAAFNAAHQLEGSNNIIVAPGMGTGNTDTRFYWSLTPHIFRYAHQNGGKDVSTGGGLDRGVHTVNEAIVVDYWMEQLRFFMTLILNADESEL
ncbi:carboxypeptidase S [Schizophyllum amplum]|uniref:Carboxypeptidase S n=1 Tax=Schizophyllum amplum TaxID=97359 RepID=A0A550CW16_9AGAR|nr:carboxypeptidase S [Auriculariopsis ampla]